VRRGKKGRGRGGRGGLVRGFMLEDFELGSKGVMSMILHEVTI
jgi:hypothetical protein